MQSSNMFQQYFGIIYSSYSKQSFLNFIQGVTEIQVQNWTMPIKTENKTFYMNDKKRLTA